MQIEAAKITEAKIAEAIRNSDFHLVEEKIF